MNNAVTNAINVYRQASNLKPLVEHPALMTSAQGQSDFMARWKILTHRGSWFSMEGARIRKAGYNWTSCGECVAEGQPTAQAVVDAWMKDAAHRDIMMDPSYTHIGVGLKNNYWTTDYAAGEPVTS